MTSVRARPSTRSASSAARIVGAICGPVAAWIGLPVLVLPLNVQPGQGDQSGVLVVALSVACWAGWKAGPVAVMPGRWAAAEAVIRAAILATIGSALLVSPLLAVLFLAYFGGPVFMCSAAVFGLWVLLVRAVWLGLQLIGLVPRPIPPVIRLTLERTGPAGPIRRHRARRGHVRPPVPAAAWQGWWAGEA